MRAPGTQMPLDLTFRPAMGRDDFLVTACNEMAVAWIDRYPDWPGPLAVLCGPPGSGKSHLLAVWAEAADALMMDAGDLRVTDLADRLGPARHVALDRGDSVAEPDGLFHLINMIRERQGHLLVAVREAPSRWTFGTPDMRSRLAAAPLLSLGEPDDEILAAVMLKLMDDRQLQARPDVIRFLIDRMPRQFEAAGRIVAELDRMSLAERRGITVPLARQALLQLGYWLD